MDNRSGLLLFGVFVLLFAFSFVFGQYALHGSGVDQNSMILFGVLALIGYVICVAFGLFNGFLVRQEGGALAVWYFGFSIISAIVTVWYLTRCGTAFGFWQP